MQYKKQQPKIIQNRQHTKKNPIRKYIMIRMKVKPKATNQQKPVIIISVLWWEN